MDVRLPNGKVIRGVPQGTPKEDIARKAVMAGLATEQEMGLAEVVGIPGGPSEAAPRQPATVGGNIVGAGETALAALTGATTGAAGYGLGAIEGLIGQLTQGLTPEQAQKVAESYAQSLTYAPRTQAGQQQTAALGEAAAMLPPVVAGFTPTQLQGAGQAARASAAQLHQAVNQVAQAVQRAPDPSLSVGAAQVPQDIVRRNRANELPIPMGDKLTKGMATQDVAQQNFELETAKNPELGKPMVDRMNELNKLVSENVDEMISMTGTQLAETDWRLQTGNKVISALKSGYDAELNKVSRAYNAARERGETQNLLPQQGVSQIYEFVNQNRAKRTNAPVLKGFADEAKVKELGSGNIEDGTFKLNDLTIEQSEMLRQEINRLYDPANGQDRFYAGQLKGMIDKAQDGAGGKVFQAARKQRMQLAGKYENLAIIDQLIDTKKGYVDQKIASEQVFSKAILNGSVADVRNLRRVLSTAGEDGVTALKEVRAAALRHIRDEATRNIGVAPDGTPRISAKGLTAAVGTLDKNGKLDILFGKDADKIRTLAEVTKDIFVAQPNASNNSNTAANVLAAIDMMVSAGVQAPAPILSVLRITAKKAKDRKIEKRLNEALTVKEENKK